MTAASTSSLLADPVFQLNVLLWTLQPLPASVRHRPYVSVLHDAGYAVKALGAPLTCDGETERRLVTEFGLRRPPNPDVLASAPSGAAWPVLECKASSFGVASSTASQAKKILARSHDVALPAGAPPGETVPGAAVWLTRAEEGAQISQTLVELAQDLESRGLSAAPHGILGLASSEEGVVLARQAGALPAPMSEALAEPHVVVPKADPIEEDPRPLYFLPYDPGVEQEPKERKRCIRILLERARVHAVSHLGRSQPPMTVVLEGLTLLREATFEMSSRWRQINDRNNAASEIIKHLRKAVAEMRDPPKHTHALSGQPRLEITLETAEERDDCTEALLSYTLPEVSAIPPTQLAMIATVESS